MFKLLVFLAIFLAFIIIQVDKTVGMLLWVVLVAVLAIFAILKPERYTRLMNRTRSTEAFYKNLGKEATEGRCICEVYASKNLDPYECDKVSVTKKKTYLNTVCQVCGQRWNVDVDDTYHYPKYTWWKETQS